jgi:hypothetical protein
VVETSLTNICNFVSFYFVHGGAGTFEAFRENYTAVIDVGNTPMTTLAEHSCLRNIAQAAIFIQCLRWRFLTLSWLWSWVARQKAIASMP